MILALDVGWYRVKPARRKELEWRYCRGSVIDILVYCGARRSSSAAGSRAAAAVRDGVLAVGVC